MKVTVFSFLLLSCFPSRAQLEETSPAAPPVIADSSSLGAPEEERRTRILGEIPDGTPPPPQPPKLRYDITHIEKGEVHCGSAAERQPITDWWNLQTN